MIATNYTQARAKLKSYMDHVRDAHEPVIITAKDGNVVLLSEESYNNLIENVFLMGNQAMSRHLDESIASVVKGEVLALTLEDLKKMEGEEK